MVTISDIPDELLPAFCGTPAVVLAVAVVCRRFAAYFKTATPVFTATLVAEDNYIIESAWYRHELVLHDGGRLDEHTNTIDCTNPYEHVYECSPKYVLIDPKIDSSVYYSDHRPWFFPLILDTLFVSTSAEPAISTVEDDDTREIEQITMRWFCLVDTFEQRGNHCCSGVRKISDPVDGFITHGGAGQFIIPVNTADFINSRSYEHANQHARALYRLVPERFPRPCDLREQKLIDTLIN